MPLGIGPMEIIVVLVIGLLVLGPKRLPGMAKSVGTGVREFRDSLTDAHDRDDEDLAPAAKPVAAAAAPSVPREGRAV
jgi:sec-independent protein translocase protein TatA